jgi:hypothetical protein
MNQKTVLSFLLFLLAAGSAGAATAVDDFFLSVENEGVEIPFSALLANDDTRALWQVVLDSGPSSGALTPTDAGFVYQPALGFAGVDTLTYHLRKGLVSSNIATVRIHVSPLHAPVAGDWDGDGKIQVGIYKNDPEPYFYLCEQGSHPYCPKYSFPDSESFVGLLPVAGNWDGEADAADEVGLYHPATGRFYLMDLGPGEKLTLLTEFQLGEGGVGDLPLAGDWNDDLKDTVGLRLAATGAFGLRDVNAGGDYDHLFSLTNGQSAWLPFAGHWQQDPSSGVGLYAPESRQAYLRDELTDGLAQWVEDTHLNGEGLVPVTGFAHTVDPERFTFVFFDPFHSLGPRFHGVTTGIGVPLIETVIPTDPDDP